MLIASFELVQPILIAAAIDYTIHNGTTPGALARKISTDIRDQRVIQAAQEKDGHELPALKPGMPGYRECECPDSLSVPDRKQVVFRYCDLFYGRTQGMQKRIG